MFRVNDSGSNDEDTLQALILASDSDALDEVRALLQEHANPNLQDEVIVFESSVSMYGKASEPRTLASL